jgi:predicted regulator of Ras-like GTPase activity (Roadblock/LC7/MglB family)
VPSAGAGGAEGIHEAPRPLGMPAIEPRAATAPLVMLTSEQASTVRSAVETLAGQLPEAAGVAFLRPDGVVVAQQWNGDGEEAPGGVLIHLAVCAQAALRALLLAGWGDLEEVEIGSRDRNLLIRRYGRGDRAGVLVLAVPRAADLSQFREALEGAGPALAEALH